MDAVYFKYSLSQCACLIKDNRFDLRQRFQIVGTFHQNAGPASAANTGKETQRDTDNQRTGTAGNQEGQGTVNPCLPCRSQSHTEHLNQRRKNCQGQGRIADCRGIDAGKTGDKVLGFGLAGGSILNQIKNFGNGGFAEFFAGLDFQHTRHVDAAADDLIAGLGITGH